MTAEARAFPRFKKPLQLHCRTPDGRNGITRHRQAKGDENNDPRHVSAWVLVIQPPMVSTSPLTSGPLSIPTETICNSSSGVLLMAALASMMQRAVGWMPMRTLRRSSTERSGFPGFEVKA